MSDLPPTDPARSSARVVAASLVAGGLITIAVAIYLGATVEPLLYVVAIAGIVDFIAAWAFATGRIGSIAAAHRLAEEQGAAAAVEADPTYNPYARED